VSRLALGPTQPPIQWVPGALSLGVKQQGHEADHSPPSSAEVKECVELYLHSPSMPSWHGAQLKHRDNFTFTFTFDFWTLSTALVFVIFLYKTFWKPDLFLSTGIPKSGEPNQRDLFERANLSHWTLCNELL